MADHKKYWVYIVASRTGTLYIGMTNNLYVRVAQHKSGEIEGFSSDYKCNRLVCWGSFDDVLKAINREKQLKGWRRAKKIVLIESTNRRWEDLAEKWGRANGICSTGNDGTVRTPCIAAGSIDGHGVLRLHFVIGFAYDKVPLRMTRLKVVLIMPRA
jgi:putative endonuclease